MHDDKPAQESDQTVDAAPDAGLLPVAVTSIGRDPSAWRWSWPAKAGYIAAGVVLPAICFSAYSGLGGNKPSWQSGEFGAYATLLLNLTPSLAFFPLLLYSMVSMIWMVCQPGNASQRTWVRLGIYTGVALAIHYSVLFPIAMSHEEVGFPALFFLISAFCAILIWAIAWLATMRAGKSHTLDVLRRIAIGLGVLAAILGVVVPWVFVVAPLLFATPWAVIAYGSMSWHILRRRRNCRWPFSLAQLLGFVLWVAAYCSAWKLSIKLMLVEYAKLPISPPTDDCYVSTAAARGHRWLVHSRPAGQVFGKKFLANNQMRYLKAAELVLAVSVPSLHRVCRACYDRLGPPAAAMLVWPMLADAAYLALKPAEWMARIALALLAPGCRHVIEEFYGDRQIHTSPKR